MIADHPVGVCSEETVQQLNSTECQSNFKGDLGFIFSTLHTIMYDMCRPDQVHNKYTIYIYYLCTFKIPGGGDDYSCQKTHKHTLGAIKSRGKPLLRLSPDQPSQPPNTGSCPNGWSHQNSFKREKYQWCLGIPKWKTIGIFYTRGHFQKVIFDFWEICRIFPKHKPRPRMLKTCSNQKVD